MKNWSEKLVRKIGKKWSKKIKIGPKNWSKKLVLVQKIGPKNWSKKLVQKIGPKNWSKKKFKNRAIEEPC
jgi:hypothetical protein